MVEASEALDIAVQADDGHCWSLLARIPAQPHATLLWLPALGVAARHYLPIADALAAAGVAVFIHEWRGNGSSNLRPCRGNDWGYRELLTRDLPASQAAVAAQWAAMPGIVGGHSLGGQLAACWLGLQAHAPNPATQLWLVASGAPYWRTFPRPLRYALPLAYRFLPWLADRLGILPGRWVGFGGDEARGLVRDWTRTGLSGRYRAEGMDLDFDAAMAGLDIDVCAVTMAHDWMGPESSLCFLLAKLPHARTVVYELTDREVGARADHFAWMKQPQAVADRLLRHRD